MTNCLISFVTVAFRWRFFFAGCFCPACSVVVGEGVVEMGGCSRFFFADYYSLFLPKSMRLSMSFSSRSDSFSCSKWRLKFTSIWTSSSEEKGTPIAEFQRYSRARLHTKSVDFTRKLYFIPCFFMQFFSSIPSRSRVRPDGWICSHFSSLMVAVCGQLNCPYSRRLQNKQSPVPSNHTALSSV